jgi:ABC-2 type transport system permease protein
MRTILYIIQKEFIQISRDKFLRTAIIMIPVIQMVILVYAATFEMKNIRIHFVDQDRSTASADLMQKFSASPFFIPVDLTEDIEAGKENLQRNKTNIVCIVPVNFEKDLISGKIPSIQLLVNSINGSMAELSMAYCNSVIRGYSAELLGEKGMVNSQVSTIGIETRHWYNEELDYKIYMAPGILALLVTLIGWMIAALNLVKEKEGGTIEQLNVSPIKKYQFIAGKLLPFMLIGLFDLAFGLTIAWLLFRIPFEGSLLTLFLFGAVYLVAVLGIGLFISTISNTQQQVLFISFFFIMIFVLMSGLFTAVENMPEWGQNLNFLNPLAYFIRVIRMVLLKGAGFADITKDFIAISLLAILTNALAIWRYRKTT